MEYFAFETYITMIGVGWSTMWRWVLLKRGASISEHQGGKSGISKSNEKVPRALSVYESKYHPNSSPSLFTGRAQGWKVGGHLALCANLNLHFLCITCAHSLTFPLNSCRRRWRTGHRGKLFINTRALPLICKVAPCSLWHRAKTFQPNYHLNCFHLRASLFVAQIYDRRAVTFPKHWLHNVACSPRIWQIYTVPRDTTLARNFTANYFKLTLTTSGVLNF